MTKTGGRIAAVRTESPAGSAGLVAGERVLEADGLRLRDVVDWRWQSSGRIVRLLVDGAQGEHEVVLERDDGDWGVEFERAVFDEMHTCDNACEFCFVSQLPAGLRPALYVRDDDFRLSFLVGNFITLTNLDPADIARILEQRLSPLYVSLHSADPEIRKSLIRCYGVDRALESFDTLHAGGIEFHVQLVLVPGVNDGPALEETLDWLEGHDRVLSVGVVPLGYTSHQDLYETGYDPAGATRVLDRVHSRRTGRRSLGKSRWIHAADEFYLLAGEDVPESLEYEGYPQYENGIGLVRTFLDGWADEDSVGAGGPEEVSTALTLCTGTSFAPVLSGLAEAPASDRDADGPSVLAVKNRFFGGGVSVTGLLTGVDLATSIREDALRPSDRPRRYAVPDIVLNEDGLTLDGLTESEVRDLARADVRFVPSDARVFRQLLPQILAEE